MRRCKYYYECDYKISITNKCLCRPHTPVDLAPYWKDIVDETNRRLNNEK